MIYLAWISKKCLNLYVGCAHSFVLLEVRGSKRIILGEFPSLVLINDVSKICYMIISLQSIIATLENGCVISDQSVSLLFKYLFR